MPKSDRGHQELSISTIWLSKSVLNVKITWIFFLIFFHFPKELLLTFFDTFFSKMMLNFWGPVWKSVPLSISSWVLQFSSLKYWFWWTWFLDYFKPEFYSRQKNPIQTRKKKSNSSNSILQTGELEKSRADR